LALSFAAGTTGLATLCTLGAAGRSVLMRGATDHRPKKNQTQKQCFSYNREFSSPNPCGNTSYYADFEAMLVSNRIHPAAEQCGDCGQQP